MLFGKKINKYFFYKVAIFLFLLLITTNSVSADSGVPSTISYQGHLSDSGGNLLGGSGTTYYFKFSFWDSPTVGSGTKVWPSSAPATTTLTVRQGVFSVNIGDTANGYPDALNYDFNTNKNIYLQVEISSNNSTFETLSPRSSITSSAFSQVADRVSGTSQSSFGTTTPITNSLISAITTGVNQVAMTIRGIASQVANLFNIQDSNGNSLFTVAANGNVGVGTSTPSAALTLGSGQLSVPNGNSSLPSIVGHNSPLAGIYFSGGATTITAANGLTPNYTNFNVNTAGVSTNRSFISTGNGSASAPIFIANYDLNTGIFAPAADMWAVTTGGTERLRINDLGNIGIGTSTPATKLDVNGTVNISNTLTQSGGYAYIGNFNSGGGIYPRRGYDLATAWNFDTGNRDISFWNTDTSAQTSFVFRQLTATSSRRDIMTLLSNGNVGIGTVSPATLLEVQGSNNRALPTSSSIIAPADGQMSIINTKTDAVFSGLYFGTTNTISSRGLIALVSNPTTNSDFSFQLRNISGYSSEVMKILGNGNVGIGTSIPSQKLDVNGNINISTSSSTSGTIYQNGNRFIHSYGTTNLFFGENSGNFTSTGGGQNVGVGRNTLTLISSGNRNTAMGESTLSSLTTGTANTAIGVASLGSLQTGSYNTAIGDGALFRNIAGNYNMAIGRSALYNTVGSGNVAMGLQAMSGSGTLGTNYSNNTAIGQNAMASINAGGDGNVAIGYQAGYTDVTANALTTGTYNNFIGYEAGFGSATQRTNATAIGYRAKVDASNALILGGTGSYAVNVGIGTVSPSEKLHLVGGKALQTYTYIGAPVATNVGGSFSIDYRNDAYDGGYAQFGLQGTALSVNGTGGLNNGGIQLTGVFGKVYTSSAQTINGASGITGQIYTDAATGLITNAYGVYAQTPGGAATNPITNSYGFYSQAQARAGTTNAYGFYSAGASDINYFAGKVGIGTINPYDKLEVSASGSGSLGGRIVISNSAASALNNSSELGFKSGATFGNGYYSGAISVKQIGELNNNNAMIFRVYGTDGVAEGAERMRITSTGNVGVGTTTPSQPLHVTKTTSGSGGMMIQSTNSSGFAELMFSNDSYDATGDFVFGYGGSATANSNQGYFWNRRNGDILFGTNATERVRITGGGNVGIGTTTPSAQLHTTGTVRFGSITGAGANLIVDADGNVTAASDERLKNIQSNFSRGLADIEKINPIIFKWKSETGYDTVNNYTGFSAQNIQLAIPEAVGVSSNGFLNLADRPILAAVVNAVKELAQKIELIVAWFGGDGSKFDVKGDVCVDNVCVTKDQFKQILIGSGGSAPVVEENSNVVVPAETSTTTAEENVSETTPVSEPEVVVPEVISEPEPVAPIDNPEPVAPVDNPTPEPII